VPTSAGDSELSKEQSKDNQGDNQTSEIDIDKEAEDVPEVDIIWHNMYCESDFKTWRRSSAAGPIERILANFGRVLETGVIDQVISVSASKHSFVAVVAITKNMDEILDKLSPAL
jgi:hypothetical protein